MPTHAELKKQAIETARQLIDDSPDGQTTGEDVARALGIDLNDDPAVNQLYHALFTANDEGSLRGDFPGGMQLPYRIRR